MRRGTILLTAATSVLSGFLFFAHGAITATSDIVINEIGAYEASGHEWVEIWNKGVEPVDMTGWKFFEDGTNHGLLASSTDSVVGPGEYAAICQNDVIFLADHPGFGGSVFDSSWSSLNESGEEIGLKDSASEIVEIFTYIAAPNYSLERIDPLLNVYDASNWKEHVASNTVGFVNSVYGLPATSTPTTTPPDITPTTTPPGDTTSTPSTSVQIDWSSLKLNEFVSYPTTGNEWVEIYNISTTTIDFTGGEICDSRETGCKNASGTVAGQGWFYLDLLTASFLNNDGDSVIFKNASGAIIDRRDFAGATAPGKGRAAARGTDGTGDWAITTSLTPGAANNITAPPVSGGGGSGTPAANTVEDTPVVSDDSSGIVINEVYPNPPGVDTSDEFIEIKNISETTKTLDGWKISDASASYGISGEILPGQILFWPRSATKIALNNTGKETVKIINSLGAIADSVEYEGSVEGESYARNASGTFVWTTTVTAGKENVFSQAGSGIVWKISAPSGGEVGELMVFYAEDTADERGGEIEISWQFDDGTQAIGLEVAHAFSSEGMHEIVVSATSTSGSFGQKKITVRIGSGLSTDNASVFINEVFANPEGTDEKEFIELFNSGSSTVDLQGWGLRSEKSKLFVFPTGTAILAGQYLTFYRTATKISINNTADRIQLINRDSEIADMVRFDKSPPDSSYAKVNGQWIWAEPTPGELNHVSGDKILIEKKVVSTKSTVKKVLGYRIATIADARQFEVGSSVRVRGTVAVTPGVFGKQYFYLTDRNFGLQMYQYKSAFPDLKVGDYLEVAGVLSNASGVKRLKISQLSDVDILETEKDVTPAELQIENITEDNLGSLVKMSGEITEIKTNYFFLDNGADEIKVYLKKSAQIDKTRLKEGQTVSVVGVLEQGTNEIQLWPRSNEDVAVASATTTASDVEKQISAEVSKAKAEKYIAVFLGAISILLIGLMGSQKGAMVIRVAKDFILKRFGRK
jgi:DNA/RNA endonuclease YhcR with UshA esterase domain